MDFVPNYYGQKAKKPHNWHAVTLKRQTIDHTEVMLLLQ